MENLSNQASALALHDDLEKTSGERVNLFYKFVEVRREWHVVVVCVCICHMCGVGSVFLVNGVLRLCASCSVRKEGIFDGLILVPQDIKKKGGVPAIAGTVQKVRAEAERLEVMDKAAGILAELLYTEKLLTQIKEYRSIMLHVSEQPLVFA